MVYQPLMLTTLADRSITLADGSKQAFKDVPTRRAYRVEQGRDELLPERLSIDK